MRDSPPHPPVRFFGNSSQSGAGRNMWVMDEDAELLRAAAGRR